jgi:membrane protease YdiL (CAAX protease family)
MALNEVFFDGEGRPRSGWRFAIFLFGFVVLSAIFGLFAFGALNLSDSRPNSPLSLAAGGVVMAAAALIAGWLCLRFLEHLPFSALGASFRDRWALNFALGLAIGALTLGLAVLIPFTFGNLSFAPGPFDWATTLRTFALSGAVFLAAAAGEEALFRGYMMQTFFRSKLRLFGVLLASILFATVHVTNPSADFLSWTNTFLAGLWFAAAYWRTGDLWFPFGLHFAWNWMMGAFFGVEVSGLTDITSAPLLKEIDRGPAWLTGESYGIEAGIACTIALIVSTVAIYFWPRRQKHEP